MGAAKKKRSAEHTPGPWQARGVYVSATQDTHMGQGFLSVAAVGHTVECSGSVRIGLTDEQMAANARLIAAAPDLLEALEAIETACAERDEHCRPVPTNHPTRAAVRAAIALARGES